MKISTILLFSLLLASCVTVPGTDRSQLILISTSEEHSLGAREFNKLKTTVPISQDSEIRKLISRVGNNISKVAPLPGAQWEFVAFNEPETPNAFCLPGGKVGIYTGILPVTHNEAGLAAVMGHEVAHAVARHGAERLSQAMLLQFGGVLISQVIGEDDPATRETVLAAYGIGSTIGVVLPHSRSNELEADKLGMLYMAKAGYDPNEAIEFWKRFKNFKGNRNKTPAFLSTHPLDDTRIAQLQKMLPEATRLYLQTIKQ